jgi:peptide/nickel transport system permease protein
MRKYLVSRLIELPLVLVGISTVIFFVIRSTGDPVALLAPPDATREDIELLRESMGLNKPVYVQYWVFLRGMATMDFGDSLVYNRPAIAMVLDRLPATLELTFLAMVLATIVAVPIGIVAGVRGGLPGNLLMVLSLIGQAMPVFWLGLLLILGLSVKLKLLPSFGRGDLKHLILPVVTLALVLMAKTSRLIRSGIYEVMTEDYITTARAKGLPEVTVLYRHALRNVAIPVITALGVDISYLLSGAVVTETVFTWPGLGRQLMQAVLSRDYPVVQATVFVVAILTVLINLLVDIVNAYIDPRILTE